MTRIIPKKAVKDFFDDKKNLRRIKMKKDKKNKWNVLIFFSFIVSIIILSNAEEVVNLFETIDYNIKAEQYKNDIFIKYVVGECENEIYKIDCVFSKVKPNIFYKDRDSWFDILKPSKGIQEGMICRDSTVIYKIIFDEFNLYNSYGFGNAHVFNIVKDEWGYCIIDMDEKRCG